MAKWQNSWPALCKHLPYHEKSSHNDIQSHPYLFIFYDTHERSFSGLNKVLLRSVQSLLFTSTCFVINILVLTTLVAVDKTCVHTVMPFLTLTLTEYHVRLSSLAHQGWWRSVTTSKLSDSKINISSKQATSNAHSSIRNWGFIGKAQKPHFFLADMMTKNDVPFQPGREFWKTLVVQNNCHWFLGQWSV